MTLAALAFAAGAAFLQLQAELPPLALGLALAPLGLAAYKWRKSAFVFAFALGFMWAALLAQHRMGDRLPVGLEGRDLDVVGVVSSLPAPSERGVRFEFEIESAGGVEGLPQKILISWYRSALYEDEPALLAGAVHPGERWLFTVRLRRPHGNVNPNPCVALLPRFPGGREEGGVPPPEPSGVPLLPPAPRGGIGGIYRRLISTSLSEMVIRSVIVSTTLRRSSNGNVGQRV